MRALADRERIQKLLQAFGRVARRDVRIYLVGGATAVLLGWRPTTIDVDLVMRPEDDAILREIPGLKETFQINVELASPLDFIPVPPGWEDRGKFVDPGLDRPPSRARVLRPDRAATVPVSRYRCADLPPGGGTGLRGLTERSLRFGEID